MQQAINRVAVFTATKSRERNDLGSKVTAFLENFEGEVLHKTVVQSSDNSFHCLSIILFLYDAKKRSVVMDRFITARHGNLFRERL